MSCSRQSAATAAGRGGVDARRDEAVVRDRVDGALGAGQVVVGDHEPVEEVAAGGDAGGGGAHTAGADEQDAHGVRLFTDA